MLRKVLFLIACVSWLAACDGDDVDGFVDLTDLRATSIEVREGGTLLLDENPVIDFDASNFGPYRVDLDSQDRDAVTLRVNAQLPDGTRFELVEVEKDESGDFPVDRISTISPGQDFTAEVAEGVNIVVVRIIRSDELARLEYVIEINRVSSSAALGDISVSGVEPREEPTSESITFDPLTIEADVLEYQVNVSANLCTVRITPFAEDRNAGVAVDGEEKDRFESTAVELDPGVERPVLIDIFPENGDPSRQYTFNVTRAAQTDEEIAEDSRLRSLTLSTGRSIVPFACDIDSLTQRVTNATTSIELTAQPAQGASTMTIGNAALDEDGDPTRDSETGRWESENDQTLGAGEVFAGLGLEALEEGDNYFVITVIAPDGEATRTYLVEVERSEVNEVFVTDADELQQALRGAQAGDLILIDSGDYLGMVSDAMSASGSGNSTAHFFSDASGTESDPIVVRAESDVVLRGDDMSQNAVLLIQGDHWEFSSMRLTGAQNGLVLDGANDNLFDGLDVDNVGERAVVMQNGSARNQLRGGDIDRTGMLPQDRSGEGITEVYGEAVVVGLGDMVGEQNAIRNVEFGRNVLSEVIDVKANASDTVIQFNIFDSDNIATAADTDPSIIRLAAEADVSYNQFDYDDISSGNNALNQVIQVVAGSTEAYQNIFNLDGQNIAALALATGAQALVADNRRIDAGELTYSGAVDQNFATPVYQIQSTVDPALCFARRDIDVAPEDGEPFTLDIVVFDTCAVEDTQLWRFVHDDEGFVLIEQSTDSAIKLRSIEGFLVPREDNDSVFDAAFFLRWRMFFEKDNALFANKANALAFVLDDEDFVIEDAVDTQRPVAVGAPVTGVAREFSLIRQ